MTKHPWLCDYCGQPARRMCTHVPGRMMALCSECRYAVHLMVLLRGGTVLRMDLELDEADLARQAEP